MNKTRSCFGFIGLVLVFWAVADAGQGTAKDQPVANKAIDEVFYNALYEFVIQANPTQAFQRLDQGIAQHEPSDNFYLYLPLYRACFDTAMRCPVPLDHSSEGKKWVAALAEKKPLLVTDLVKLIAVSSTETHPVDPEPYFQAITTQYPQSPWAEWAKWKTMEAQITKKAAGLKPYGCVMACDHILSFEAWKISDGPFQILRHVPYCGDGCVFSSTIGHGNLYAMRENASKLPPEWGRRRKCPCPKSYLEVPSRKRTSGRNGCLWKRNCWR